MVFRFVLTLPSVGASFQFVNSPYSFCWFEILDIVSEEVSLLFEVHSDSLRIRLAGNFIFWFSSINSSAVMIGLVIGVSEISIMHGEKNLTIIVRALVMLL